MLPSSARPVAAAPFVMGGTGLPILGLAPLGFGNSSVPPSMSTLLQQQAGLGLSPAVVEMRQRQQAESDLVRLLLQQQQQQQQLSQQQLQQPNQPNEYPLQRFLPRNP